MGRGKAQRSLDLIDAAHEILEEIQPASVRAVCYQLFNRGLIESMEKKSTNRVSELLTAAREDGTIPWEWIVQEGRGIERVSTWRDPAAFARTVMDAYRKDKWEAQPRRVMVVSEKGTIRGTLEPVLNTYEVDFLPIGGYSSSTRVHDLASSVSLEHPLLVCYLGDYDPSGLSMSVQDFPRRLASYANTCTAPTREEAREWDDEWVDDFLAAQGLTFQRIALTELQCHQIGRRLSFPASDKRGTYEKKGDTRYPWFVEHYGDTCWELDAMSPVDLRACVETAITAEIEPIVWERYVRAEQVERESIETTLTRWNSISGLASQYEARP